MNDFKQIIGTKIVGIDSERSHEIETYDNIEERSLSIDFIIIKDCNLGSGGIFIIQNYPNIIIKMLYLDSSNSDELILITTFL